MCGRIDQHSEPTKIADPLGVRRSAIRVNAFKPRYNLAPSLPLLALRLDAEQERELVALKWGLLPFWSKALKTPYATINARAETLARSPAYREPFKARRCVVPIDGYYEWQVLATGKQPHYITSAGPEGLLLAGLWDRWAPEDGGEPVESVSIITTAANAATAAIHARMPVVLDDTAVTTWLAGDSPPDVLQGLLVPCLPEIIRTWVVSPRVNSARHDAPDCIAPVAA